MNNTINVYFRVDAGLTIGLGHLNRSLCLALEFKNHGANCIFFIHSPSNTAIQILEHHQLQYHCLKDPTHFEEFKQATLHFTHQKIIVVKDHYQLQFEWEKKVMTEITPNFLVIDDFPEKPHYARWYLDQNWRMNYFCKSEQEKTVEKSLMGPQFALLSSKFIELRKNILSTKNNVTPSKIIKNILVSFGGATPTQELVKALEALTFFPNFSVTVVCGKDLNLLEKELQRFINIPHFKFIGFTNQFPEILSQANLFIGAGGSTTWERFCLGIPGIITTIAENQKAITQEIARAGLQIYLGHFTDTTSNNYKMAIQKALDSPDILEKMREKTFNCVDGLGAKRVIEFIQNSTQIFAQQT